MFLNVLGDSRANEQHALTVMHVLWLREHNRIAQELENEHPNWNDEKLFQETRRIVIAEYQHIIYNEWLILILGEVFMTNFGLMPISGGRSKMYLDEGFDPRITNEFATAAFRFGHSLIPPSFTNVINRKRNGTERLRDVFNKPKSFVDDPG